MSSSLHRVSSTKRAAMAFHTAFSATPPKITVVLDAFIRYEKRKIIKTVTRLPEKAAHETANPENVPAARQSVTPSPAPALTPIIPGEASLLSKTFCSTAPDTERAAPEANAASVRGSLA